MDKFIDFFKVEAPFTKKGLRGNVRFAKGDVLFIYVTTNYRSLVKVADCRRRTKYFVMPKHLNIDKSYIRRLTLLEMAHIYPHTTLFMKESIKKQFPDVYFHKKRFQVGINPLEIISTKYNHPYIGLINKK